MIKNMIIIAALGGVAFLLVKNRSLDNQRAEAEANHGTLVSYINTYWPRDANGGRV